MPETPRRAIIYARISRDRAGAGLGIERQVADCQELADRLGWTVVETITENDVSAYKGVRRGYRRLLQELENCRADAVIAWHNDRLHRAPIELEYFISVVEKCRVAVHFVQSGETDLTTPAGRMQARQLGVFARYESEHRSARVKAARDQMADQGRWAGGQRPFGWNADGSLNDAEALLLRAGIEMLLSGGSLRGIARLFNASDLRTTRRGKDWDPLSVADVLRRPRNAGRLIHRGKDHRSGDWTPVMTVEELAAVEDILRSHARRTSPGNQPRWLGSLIYRCGLEGCSDTLVVGTSGQNRKASYRCQTSIRTGGAKHVTRAAKALDGYIEETVLDHLLKPDFRELYACRVRSSVDVTALHGELAAIDEDRIEVTTRRTDGRMSWAQFDIENNSLIDRQRQAEAALAAAQRIDPVADLLGAPDPAARWAHYHLDRKRDILRRVVTVTVLPAGRGRQPGGGYFDPSRIRLDWHEVITDQGTG